MYVTFLKVKVAQLCLTLCNPMDCTVHGILQARTLEWVAVPFSRIHEILQARILEQAANPLARGSSQPRDQTQVSCTEADSLPA